MFNTILVPLDGSARAEFALDVTKQLAPECIVLLRVADLMQNSLGMEYGAFPMQTFNYEIQEAEAYLRELSARPVYATLPLYTNAMIGHPARAIVEKAEAVDADLIVMTTHGYQGIQRLLYGSVTEQVLRHANCPVLVLRDDAPLKHIVVAVDGSPLAEQSLAPALELAARLGADVTLLCVEESEKDVLDAEHYLDALLQTWQRPAVTIATKVVKGHAAEQILAESNSSVISISTHGRSGLQRWVYGSVTEKVLRQTDQAMLIVRPIKESVVT